MPRLRTPAICSLALALTCLAVPAPLFAASPPAPAAQAPGELIVRFAPAANAGDRGAARGQADVDFERTLPLSGVQLVKADPGQSVPAAVAELERSPDVVYAEPNFVRQVQAVPNDPFFPNLNGLNNTGQSVRGFSGTPDADIDAPEAWDLTTGSPNVVAAVVDSGVDVGHPDLSSSIWRNPGESGGGRESNRIDDDANGLVDDWRGWDWATDDNLPTDENGHGTHVSGTIAASGNDGVGVTGVSQSSRVMALRVLDAAGSGTVADLVSAYRYAGAKGARIVNASLGGSGFSRTERDAIDAAPNTLFVVAAGNGGDDGVGDNVDTTPEYPCAYTAANIVCVAASDQNDRLAGFSNFGSGSVDLAAPGVNTLSTVPGGYSYFSGTSMATPHTAGVAALIWSLEPGAGVAGVKAALLGGTDAKSAFTGRTATGGRLNAARSLQLAAGSGGVAAPVAPPAVPSAEPSDPDPERGAPPEEAEPTPAPAPAPTPAPLPAPSPAPAPAVALDRSAPVLSLALASRRRLQTVLTRGLALRARCSERCGLNLRQVVDGATSRRSGLARSRRAVVVGRGTVVVTPRARKIVIRLSSKARIRLRRLRGVRLTVRGVASDAVGNVRRHSLRTLVRR